MLSCSVLSCSRATRQETPQETSLVVQQDKRRHKQKRALSVYMPWAVSTSRMHCRHIHLITCCMSMRMSLTRHAPTPHFLSRGYGEVILRCRPHYSSRHDADARRWCVLHVSPLPQLHTHTLCVMALDKRMPRHFFVEKRRGPLAWSNQDH